MSALLDAALAYAARGWPVFPCTPGAKTPAGQLVHRGVLDASTDPAQISAWWTAEPGANVGIATGSPGPDVVDIDVKEGGSGWQALAAITQAGLADGSSAYVRTPSGGLHAYYAGTSQRNGSIRKQRLDFRAAGGYVLAPPSIVGGRPYELAGTPGGAAPVDWAAIRAYLDPPPDPVPFSQPNRSSNSDLDSRNSSSELRPGDDWAARTTWAEILQPRGWRRTRDLGNGRAMWRRPGKKDGSSATTREDGGLYVFSSSTEFEVEVPYSKFGAIALLEHGGDHAKAASALRAAGYGTPLPAPAITFAQPLTQLQQPAADGQDPADGDAAPASSWRPVDLTAILAGDASGDPEPTHLARDDGKMLLYAGKINALIGESESGKTWIALAAAAEALSHGQRVAYLDFEDAPAGITGRLLALGATPEQLLKQLDYIAPDEPLTAQAVADLADVLAQAPGLAVLDGVNAAMTMLGLNLTDNKDVTHFSQLLLRPLKRTGAAVLTVDHVTKSKDGRGLNAIGAQAKRADIDGAAYIVEAISKFGRGHQGKLRLTVSKDRPGHIRAISAGATYAGMATLTPHDDGTITVTIDAPADNAERDDFRPTMLMQRVSQFLESEPEGANTNTIKESVKGKGEWIARALAQLVTEGWAACETGPRNARTYTSAKPYREISEHQMPPVPTDSPPIPTDSRNRSSDPPRDRFPTGSHPRRGEPVEPVSVTGAPEPDAQQPPIPARPDACTRCGEIRSHAPRCNAARGVA